MKKNAFTLVELLIVIGVSAVLVALSGGVYIALEKRSSIDIQARELKSVLILARNRTLASEEEQRFGVHIATSTKEYILFKGASYSATSTENEQFIIEPRININSVNLRGGGHDVIFQRLTGITAQYGSITLQDAADSSRIQTICIDSSGSIEIQTTCPETSIDYTLGLTDSDLASFPANSGFGDPAQSFTNGSTSTYAHQVDLYIRRTTADPSDIYLEIRQTNTVGNVIGRSWMVDGASLPQSFGWVSFTFPRPVFLAASTQYFLRLRSLPDSTISSSGAVGTIHWGYEHSASAPPAYSGGDAWRYVGQNNVPIYQGQRLGPADQYDFSFSVIYGIDPPAVTDSRHLEFDLGWSITGYSTLRLTYQDPPSADVVENVTIVDYYNSFLPSFDWAGSTNVNGDTETLRVHTHYIDANDTTLSIHRDRRDNGKAVDVSIDGRDIVSYAADGTATVGSFGGVMTYR